MKNKVFIILVFVFTASYLQPGGAFLRLSHYLWFLCLFICFCFSEIGLQPSESEPQIRAMAAPKRDSIISFTPPYLSLRQIWHVRINESQSRENTELSLSKFRVFYLLQMRTWNRCLSTQTYPTGTSPNHQISCFITLKLVDITKKNLRFRCGIRKKSSQVSYYLRVIDDLGHSD